MTQRKPRHPLMGLWNTMIQRCHNPNNRSFKRYGAAGVFVCERWRKSFKAFCEDVGPRPSQRHSLDRFPNASGGYVPGNVRWATRIEQAHNRKLYRIDAGGEKLIRTNIFLEDYMIDGLREESKRTGLAVAELVRRAIDLVYPAGRRVPPDSIGECRQRRKRSR